MIMSLAWILQTDGAMAHETYVIDFPRELLMANRTDPPGINLGLESGRIRYAFASAWHEEKTGNVIVSGDYTKLLDYQKQIKSPGLPEEFQSSIEVIIIALETGQVQHKSDRVQRRRTHLRK